MAALGEGGGGGRGRGEGEEGEKEEVKEGEGEGEEMDLQGCTLLQQKRARGNRASGDTTSRSPPWILPGRSTLNFSLSTESTSPYADCSFCLHVRLSLKAG